MVVINFPGLVDLPGHIDVDLGQAAFPVLLVGVAVGPLYVRRNYVWLGDTLGALATLKVKDRVDILWAGAAYAVTIAHNFFVHLPILQKEQFFMLYFLGSTFLSPALWVVCIYFMVKLRKRSLWFFW
jgi:hypothetical protein